VKLVADANVLLSAVLGGRANLVLRHPLVEEILTTEVTLSEVEEYAAQLARKKGLSLDVVLMAVAALPLTLVDQATYSASLPEANAGLDGAIQMTWISWPWHCTPDCPCGRTTTISATRE